MLCWRCFLPYLTSVARMADLFSVTRMVEWEPAGKTEEAGFAASSVFCLSEVVNAVLVQRAA